MHTARKVRQRRAQFFGEERPYRVLRPVFTHPEQNPPLQVVYHGEIDLAFAPAHLVDPNRVHRRAPAMLQPIRHGALHDRRHAFPVQAVLASRALPTRLPRQHRYGVRERLGRPRPRLRPRKILYPHAAARTLHTPRPVPQLQRRCPHREVAPLPLPSCAVHLQAPLPANPAAQKPLSQTIDMRQHGPVLGLFHLRDGVRLQSQLLSEERLHLHSRTSLQLLDAYGIQTRDSFPYRPSPASITLLG
jgi:hypothetical protein